MIQAARINSLLTLACAGILTLANDAVAADAPPAPAQVFTLVPAIRHQTMDNFGANDAWSLQKIGAWSETNKQRLAELLFSTNTGIGLSCWRFNLGAGINHATIDNDWRTVETFETAAGQYDWTHQANERWFLRAAKAYGIQQFAATVYSPPLRLTRNGLSNLGADKISTTNLKPGAEDAFATYLTDILAHFRTNADPAERIDFNYILPVNEPQWDWTARQEGNRAANADLKRIYLALKQRLIATGLPTAILGPESGSIPDMYQFDAEARQKWHADYGNYLHTICDDPALAACFNGILTYHSYWSDQMPNKLMPDRNQLGRAFAAHPGWRLWQSEYCIMESGRDLGMQSALRVARIIHCDLTVVGASAWQWWEAVANEDFKSGLIYTDYEQPGDPENILDSKILWVLGNYSRFIRPGMIRIELRGGGQPDLNGTMGSAYLNPQNGQLVVVFVNEASHPALIRLALAGDTRVPLAGRHFTAYITSESKSLTAEPLADVTSGYELPPRSVVSLVSNPD